MAYAKILKTDLLNDSKKLDEIDKWLKLIDWDNGWHYDLDIIWILSELERNNVKKGSTILDAGAGLGIIQFILASRGYNVISLDFAPREIPAKVNELFDIEVVDNDINDSNPYREFIKYDSAKKTKLEVSSVKYLSFYLHKKINKASSFFKRKTYKIFNEKPQGKITFLMGSFNDIPLDNNSVDAIVSVSAIEHNDYECNKKAVSEFKRVLKKDGVLALTTNCTNQEKSWFHEESLGWCFSKSDFKTIFETNLDGDYDKVESEYKSNDLLLKRIPWAYYVSSRSGLPFGNLNNLKYLPVGVFLKNDSL